MNPGKERMESPNIQRDQKCRAKWHLEASKNFSVFHTLSKSWAPTMSWEACNKFLELEGGEKQTQSSCFHWDESNDTSQADPLRTCRGASTLTKTWVSGKAFQSNHCVEVHRLNLRKPGLRCRKNFRQGKQHPGSLGDQGNLGRSRNENGSHWTFTFF